jgi:hypothetical protein
MAQQPQGKPKIYCGDKNLPEEYDRYGSRYECLRRGVGVGLYVIPEQRRQKAVAARRPITKEELEKIAKRLGVQVAGRTKQQLLNAVIIALERRA